MVGRPAQQTLPRPGALLDGGGYLLALFVRDAEHFQPHGPGQPFVVHVQVQFGGGVGAQVVQVEGTQGTPASVAHGQLGMKYLVLVREYFNAMAQQPRMEPPPGQSGDAHVAAVAHDQGDADAAIRCLAHGAPQGEARQEVGRHELDIAARFAEQLLVAGADPRLASQPVVVAHAHRAPLVGWNVARDRSRFLRRRRHRALVTLLAHGAVPHAVA